ncbi:Efflux pump FUBT [Mycena venus]|uniref:Efflux pump FUBT n=1 Tax=Mycena venus TaxID=2733690 RepID=A0A8H7CJG1_9AGAR|nr:Efflux pump FUBT [Mycena venus]
MMSKKALPAPSPVARKYPGSGTQQDPYVVDWDSEEDPENPLNFPNCKKWIITSQLAFATWTISFGSSVYSGGLETMARDLNISDNVAILGLSLYVLGFALGPLANLCSHGRDVWTTIRLFYYPCGIRCISTRRMFGGTQRLCTAVVQVFHRHFWLFTPIIGPIVGGAVVMKLEWHFNFWLMFIFSVLSLLSGAIFTPETYAPVLLRRRTNKLARGSNGIVHYVSIHDCGRPKSIAQALLTTFSRPFVFLVTEPIVLCVALYISIVYGTLYALFAAFPIVFQQHHHFTSAQNGLAFIGIGIGIILGLASTPIQNRVYWRAIEKSETGRAAPEARLHQAMVGGVLIPIGLFWFAFSVSPSVHWIVPIVGSAFFGMGISQILQSLTSYLMDAYELYFASAVASTIVLRSVCAAFLPQVVPSMFSRLGDETAMCVFGVLGLICTPIPFLFWASLCRYYSPVHNFTYLLPLQRYGRWIRTKSSVAYKEPLSDSSSEITRCETQSEKDVEHP